MRDIDIDDDDMGVSSNWRIVEAWKVDEEDIDDDAILLTCVL